MFKYLLSLFIITVAFLHAEEDSWNYPWSKNYHTLLVQKSAKQLSSFASFPSLQYPNNGHEQLPDLFPNKKILLFGYGSLMNVESASRSMSPEAIASMKPVIAFGVKRLFNYKANKTDHWGSDQHSLEKAMLNLAPTTSYKDVINGVVLEVEAQDLPKLVQRELGYDLVPILIANWEEVSKESPSVPIRIAYTFVAAHELRNHVDYTTTRHYPVRGYLSACRAGALTFGEDFLNLWNHTTYLADGITRIDQWDEQSFEEILCTKEP